MTHPFVSIAREAHRLAREANMAGTGSSVTSEEVLLAGILCQLYKLAMPVMIMEAGELSEAQKAQLN